LSDLLRVAALCFDVVDAGIGDAFHAVDRAIEAA
jgi:hypothetical protein